MEILRAESLVKHFSSGRILQKGKGLVRAVDDLDFSLDEDSVLAIVGESGCGKSTVARLVLRLIRPTSGSVFFKGEEIFGFDRASLRLFRRSVQIIFQDPFASLNPRKTVYDTISEPLKIHKLAKRAEFRDAVVAILEKVGLRADILPRYPHEFSGGQRQRICIARALAVSPRLIVADEPLSALDVSIQAQILNLLLELKQESGISFLFISHDLRVVRYFSDAVAVMYLGKIVEHCNTEDLFARPLHPYTTVLLESAPKVDMQAKEGMRAAPLKGDVPSPLAIPPGCPFHPRCPERFDPCDRIVPELKDNGGRLVACHLRNSY